MDSTLTTDDLGLPQQTWSCFEPQLVAKWFCAIRPGPCTDIGDDLIAPGSFDLAIMSRITCRCEPRFPIGTQEISFPGGFGNGYEVIQYWWPEHQASTNNYGTDRLDPSARRYALRTIECALKQAADVTGSRRGATYRSGGIVLIGGLEICVRRFLVYAALLFFKPLLQFGFALRDTTDSRPPPE